MHRIITRLRRDVNQWQPGGGIGGIDEAVAGLTIRPGVGAVVQLHGDEGAQRLGMTQDKVDVLLRDFAEGGKVAFVGQQQVGKAHFGQHGSLSPGSAAKSLVEVQFGIGAEAGGGAVLAGQKRGSHLGRLALANGGQDANGKDGEKQKENRTAG